MNQNKAANSPLERGGPDRVGCVTEPESPELVKARLIYLAAAVFGGLFAITAIAIHYLGIWPTAAIGALVVSIGGWLMVWGIHRELRAAIRRPENAQQNEAHPETHMRVDRV